jgi:serine/threonine protein kinase
MNTTPASLLERLRQPDDPADADEALIARLCGSAGQATAVPDASAAGEAYAFLAPAERPDELGRLGPYRILRVLGRGGMGVVFEAEDAQLGRPVALKVMRPYLAASADARQRFQREARATAAVKSDHIITIYQVGEDRGAPYLAMELLPGEALERRLARGDRPDTAEVLRLAREMALGLAAAHERGLIHRDLKPGNVWLEAPAGRVKLLDFGLARAAKDDAHLTRSGAVLGTPAYMAPEQARGDKLDHRADLFSLGAVLYQLCTGQMPFGGETAMAVLTALAVENPKPVREIAPDVPPALADLVMHLLAKAPADRPQTAKEVVAALQTIEREAAPAPPGAEAGRPPLAVARGGRRRAAGRAGAAGLVLRPGRHPRRHQQGRADCRGR